MSGFAQLIRSSVGTNRLSINRLFVRRTYSARATSSERDWPHENGNKTWNMLQKQEHMYATMFTSGEVDVESQGIPEVTGPLIEALRLQQAYGHPYTPKDLPLLTHAFHVYPAGMQPATARHLLETVLPGNSVMDPFVGGGTVVLEAMRVGRLGVGSDISPLALFVSRGRCWTASDRELQELRQASRAIVAASSAKLDSARSRRISGNDWEVVKTAIAAHIATKELGKGLQSALWFVFAVARTKAAKARHRRTGGRFSVVADRYFQSTCNEYAGAVALLTRAATAATAPRLPSAPVLVHRDARQLISIPTSCNMVGHAVAAACTDDTDSAAGQGGASVQSSKESGCRGEDCDGDENRNRISSGSDGERIPSDLVVDAVLTSPPYPGVYDYLGHARYARSQLGALPRSQPSTDALSHPNDEAVATRDVGLDRMHDGAHDISVGRAGGASVYVDSPVPSGRDWPLEWTRGEIGAKSEVRRRRRRAASRNPKSDSLLEGVSTEAAGAGGESGTVAAGLLAAKWIEDQRAWLDATTSALKVGGRMVVMVGDGDGIDTRSCLLGEINASRPGGGGGGWALWGGRR